MLLAVIVLGLVALFCVLVMLALMREMVLMRAELQGALAGLGAPQLPSYIGTAPPDCLSPLLGHANGTEFVVFLSEGCPSCIELLSRLEGDDPEVELLRPTVRVVAACHRSSTIPDRLQRLGLRTLVDHDQKLLAACEIAGTPSILAVRRQHDATSDLEVFAFSIEGGVEWMTAQAARPAEALTEVSRTRREA